MATTIEMPKLSDTMTVGTLVAWLKKKGDKVASGDMIAEIETDKATMELENFDEGVILETYVKEGDQVEIGAPICAIGEEGEEAPEVSTGSPGKKEEPEEISKSEEPEKKVVKQKPEAPGPAPKAEKQTPPPEAPSASGGDRIKASPLARKIAASHDIPLEKLTGTGPGGRIVKADVMKAVDEGVPEESKPAAPAAFAAPAGGEVAEEADIPLSNMRMTIAKRLVESKTQIPHFYLEIEVDPAPLLQLRADLNGKLAELPPEQGGIRLSVNDLILKASVEAIRRVPVVNRSWAGDSIRQHGAVHLSFAVGIDDGLLTPVIFDAHAKTLRQIAAEAGELALKAKNKKLKPEEMTGSTFTVTNLGMFGTNRFYGIINPPNAGILSVGATVAKPVVAPGGSIAAGQRMSLGLSGDHRVIDGVSGARFLAALKEIIETPALMLV